MDYIEKEELLAKFLFDIHCNQLSMFYDDSDASSWTDLPYSVENQEDVDKDFFHTIARDFLKMQIEDNLFDRELPRLLYEIHSSTLPPYYMTFENYKACHNDPDEDYYINNWTTLPDKTDDDELVGKDFFFKMAKYIIDEINK